MEPQPQMIQPNHKILPLNYQPQRNEFKFNNIKFSSNFDSGNLLNVVQVDDNNEYLYRTWFYFGIYGAKDLTLRLKICNMNNQLKSFQDGYKIVYRRVYDEETGQEYKEDSYFPDEEFKWKRFSENLSANLTGDDKKTLQISFEYNFKFEDEKGVLFSFCYPWSYQKNQKFLEHIEANFSKNMHLYYNREILSYSKEKRRLDLITISSTDNITNIRETLLKGLFPTNNKYSRPFSFSKEKPIIFISARVHPGETPASYLMNGIIKFLLDKSDPRSKILRKYFVFKIIPIINVDGVSRGFYRYDTNSLNMNRHYPNPNQKIQPEIYAIRRLFLFYSQEYKVRYYYDLHAHVQSKGLFLFGNSLDFLFQVENCIIPKLIEINCEYLNFDNCILTEKCMKSKERGDKYSKEGTGRVHFNKCTGIIHAYTIEASYFRVLNKNEIPEINLEDKLPDEKFQLDLKQIINNYIDFDVNSDFIENRAKYKKCFDPNLFTPVEYEKMGFSLLIAILDYEELNPYSRVFKSEYSNLSNLRKFISNRILKEDDKYRNNVMNQNLNKDICAVKKFIPLFEKFINHLNNLIIKKSLKLLSKDGIRHNSGNKEIYDFRKKLLTSRKINSDNNLISSTINKITIQNTINSNRNFYNTQDEEINAEESEKIFNEDTNYSNGENIHHIHNIYDEKNLNNKFEIKNIIEEIKNIEFSTNKNFKSKFTMNNLIKMKESLSKTNSKDDKKEKKFYKDTRTNKLISYTPSTNLLNIKIKSYPK